VVSFSGSVAADVDRIRAALVHTNGLRHLHTLARVLTDVFDSAYAFVAERSPGDPELAQTVAVAHRGGPVGDLVYLIAGTPCSDVIRGGSCRLARGARYLYPTDRSLMEMDVESYVGVLLAANGGTSCGWLGVMDTRPRTDTHHIEAVLKAIAARTSIELASMRLARRELMRREAEARRATPVHTGFTPPSD
jgi:hypothetical protein